VNLRLLRERRTNYVLT